jgi:probable phosphoglycerate mutase
MKPVYLIRHGQGENNVNMNVGGWSDPSLTNLGIRQAEAVAERLSEKLKDEDVVLYSSHIKRAYQTAQKIAEKLNVSPIIDENLRECIRRFPPDLSQKQAQQYALEYSEPVKDYRMYVNCESFGELYKRAADTVSRILKDEDRVVVLVSHIWFLDKVISWWLGIGVDNIKMTLFNLDNASISILSKNRHNERTLLRSNDTSHLIDLP